MEASGKFEAESAGNSPFDAGRAGTVVRVLNIGLASVVDAKVGELAVGSAECEGRQVRAAGTSADTCFAWEESSAAVEAAKAVGDARTVCTLADSGPSSVADRRIQDSPEFGGAATELPAVSSYVAFAVLQSCQPAAALEVYNSN